MSLFCPKSRPRAHRRATLTNHAGQIHLMLATDIGGDLLVQARARLRAASAHAAESALRIVEMLAADAGSTAIFENCPLERAVRDVQAAVKRGLVYGMRKWKELPFSEVLISKPPPSSCEMPLIRS
jgi:hypothetical protein